MQFYKSGIRKAYRVGKLKTLFIMNWFIKVVLVNFVWVLCICKRLNPLGKHKQ